MLKSIQLLNKYVMANMLGANLAMVESLLGEYCINSCSMSLKPDMKQTLTKFYLMRHRERDLLNCKNGNWLS